MTSPSGKVYIGQTNNVYRRMVEHKRNSDRNTKLYSSIRRYGIESFDVDILFIGDSRYESTRMEQFYVIHYNAIENGLNHIPPCRPSSGFTGKKHSKKAVADIRNRKAGFVPEKAIAKRSKKVFCDMNNKEYKSISDCARDLNLSQGYVSLCLSGKRDNKIEVNYG